MIKPAARVATMRKDVWSIVNEAAGMAAAAGRPVINLGQGFLYSPLPLPSFTRPDMLDFQESLTPVGEADTIHPSS